MTLFIVAIFITGIAAYFLHTSSNEEKKQSFKDDCLVALLFIGFIMALVAIATGVLNYFDVPEKGRAIFLITVPILTLSLLAIWATWGDSKNKTGSAATDDKKDITAEAILLTAILSEDDESKESNPSSSSGSNHSSSNSDDFFLL